MKLKKFLSLFVMALLVFVFSGCGGSSNRKIVPTTKLKSADKYVSTTSSENALLITEGSPTYENITVYKTGDATGDQYDKDGNNAAILARNGATPMISKASPSRLLMKKRV